MWTACIGPLDGGYPIQRKVIDPSGRLGSLYNASTDTLVDRHSVPQFQTKLPHKRSICRVFSGDSSRELISFLGNADFNDATQRSIRLRMVMPLGISRFIEYNQRVNDDTYFLYYCHKTRKDILHIQARKAHKVVSPPVGQTEATHMITKILWGIEILCVIQVPRNNQSHNMINQLLNRICERLKHDEFPIRLTDADRQLINQLNTTTVYGTETCVDDPNISLPAILTRIQEWQRNDSFHQPIIYTMQPLRWLFNNNHFREPCVPPDDANIQFGRIDRIRKRIEKQLKDLHDMIQNLPANFSSRTLTQNLNDAQRQYNDLLENQEDLEKRLRTAIPDVRRHRSESSVLDRIVEDQRYECLHAIEIEKVQTTVGRLISKAILIEELKKSLVEYINAFDFRPDGVTSPTNDEIDATIKRFCAHEQYSVILWYSSDRLKREQADRWQQIYQQLTSERHQTTQNIKLIYVDFTNCRERLEGFTVVQLPSTGRAETGRDPISDITSHPSRTIPVSSLSNPRRQPPPLPSNDSHRSITPPPFPTTLPSVSHPSLPASRSLSSLPATTDINIVLLGETGVGKSTFINAFVNYLKFETLQQAERDKPIALIPVSFLVTVGDQFDEVIVKFGDADSNENYEHQGESVTQQCKSYVFDLKNRIRIRLIDTPGIGDTRGIDQDIKNIDHILTYISNLSHINAICLLLKPNASRLNIFFRSCIKQLLTYVTPVGYSNIIFCFTNARATFYAPGDTGPLLRRMLNDENLNIPFQKDNTFCFDSESFRYLAARKCRVNFDDYQKKECTDSWNTSVVESLRLLNYIQTREPYYFDDWLSPRKIALDISMLARPVMETLRLIIYNWKLSEAKLIANQINLNSNQIESEICTHCAQTNLVEVGPFWITQYQRPLLQNHENQHRLCPSNGREFLIETIIQYQLVTEPAGLKNERWQSSFHNFLLKCDTLVYFLRQHGLSAQHDPFQPILERFLEEEQQISQIRNINSNMNRRVREILLSIGHKRQVNIQQLTDANERLSLNQVYQIVNELMIIPTVKKQIDSIKISRQLKMKAHEHRIPTNTMQNRIFF